MNRNTLIGVAAGIGAALLVLMIYSLDRTSWLFAIFESGRAAAETYGYAAAIVVEVAAVALIVGDGVANLLRDDAAQRALRLWSGVGLIFIFGVQVVANFAAGYIRGGEAIVRAIGEGGFTAVYVIAAVAWGMTNALIPALIFALSKIEAHILRLLLAAPAGEVAPARETLRDRLRRFGGALRERLGLRPKAAPALPAQSESDSPEVQPAAPEPSGESTPAVPEASEPASRIVTVSPEALAIYTRILALLDEAPDLPTKLLAQRLGRGERTAQIRRGELVRLGVLHEAGGRFVRNGVELRADR